MRKMTKILLVYIAITLTWSILFGGFFSALCRSGCAFGGSGKVGVKEILLDALTLPVQIVFLLPPVILDRIRENTGERGKIARAKREWYKAKLESQEKLRNDFGSIFNDERYFRATNTPQREMLGEWLCWYNLSRLTTQQVERVVGKVMEKPCLLKPLAAICMRGSMTPEQRDWCMNESLRLATNGVVSAGDQRAFTPIYWMLQNPTVTDEEFCRVAEMGIKGCDIAGLMASRIDKRSREIRVRLVTTLDDGNASFLDRPESISYKALRPAIHDCRHITPKNLEYLFNRIERNPKLIDECLELYEFENGMSQKRRCRNREFALLRAEEERDARILLKVICLHSTPQEYKDAVLANPRLAYCREDVLKALADQRSQSSSPKQYP